MEKGKSAVTETASTLRSLHLNQHPETNPSSPSLHPYSFLVKKHKPRRLVSLCLGVIGQHLEDIIPFLPEIAVAFPPDIKLALVAIARRRKLLTDDILLALMEKSWDLLDISGSDVTDIGLAKVAQFCSLRSIDISRCDQISPAGFSDLIRHNQSLEILRCGGCPRSDSTARRCLSFLKPKLNDREEESWEELDSMDIGEGAHSLRWLVWTKIDEVSKVTLATECPRIIVNPRPSSIHVRGTLVPTEALASIPLDHSVIDDIDPKTWIVCGASRRAPLVSVSGDALELPMAEKFRLAFVERDARLAPKRAKNARQHKRRADREWLKSSTDAKSVVLASQATKFLHNRG